MSINKSQGQIIDEVRLNLSKPVFSSGQLYVCYIIYRWQIFIVGAKFWAQVYALFLQCESCKAVTKCALFALKLC